MAEPLPTTERGRMRASVFSWLMMFGLAITYTVLFWQSLWSGGTLIGGDTFSYYFPQKWWLAESLQRGEFPLWNPWVGAGYPIVAESQTGLLYPPTLFCYRFLDVHLAYSANQILHYVLAFLGMIAVTARYGMSRRASVLAAVVYVYGWFAPRICLEWAIIGGAYLPWCAWIVETWLRSGRPRDLLWLGPVFGLFLLAGHFHLAFITTFALCLYVALRVIFSESIPNGPMREQPTVPSSGTERVHWSKLLVFGCVMILGYAMAAVQLGPTLELMARSQRHELTGESDPGYGHIPPWYLTQVISSWIWYLPGSDPDQALFHVGKFAYPCATNKVEAHLYFGMVPLSLILFTLGNGLLSRRWPFSREVSLWLLIGLLGVAIATGWPLMFLKHLPGFGYFRGAGRYSLLMSFAAALAVGAAWDAWNPACRVRERVRSWGLNGRGLAWVVVLGLTTWELYLVSRWVTYAVMLETPILPMRDSSEIRQALEKYPGPVRLWSPGSNAATLLGVSAFPVYLGLGPREYYDPPLVSTYVEERDGNNPSAISKQVDWLRRNGVTHLISFDPLDETNWSVSLMYRGFDQLLCRVWARYDKPLYLYELNQSTGRVVDSQGRAITVNDWHQTANHLTMTLTSENETKVIVRELNYPGWKASIDGKSVETRTADGMYRELTLPSGTHHVEWSYRPVSLWWGAGITGLAVLVWCLVYRMASGRHPRSTTT